VLLTNLQCRH